MERQQRFRSNSRQKFDTKTEKKALRNVQSLNTTSVVSVTQFAVSRLPEIQQLVAANSVGETKSSTTDDVYVQALESGGRKTSCRHLRRRARSFQKKRCYRNGKESTNDDAAASTPSRRAKRQKTKTLYEPHFSWRNEPISDVRSVTKIEKRANSNTSSSNSTNWMTTHVWHAKRFRMEELWDWKIPLQHTNRGCHAAIRLARTKCVVYDATWCQPIVVQLRTVGDAAAAAARIVKAIQSVVQNFTSIDTTNDNNNGTASFSNSVLYGEGMMHEPQQFPLQPICPVTWLQKVSTATIPSSSRKGQTAVTSYSITGLFFVHPSVRSRVQIVFDSILSNNSGGQDTKDDSPSNNERDNAIDGASFTGSSCLKLRGQFSEEAFLSTVAFLQQQSNERKAPSASDIIPKEDVTSTSPPLSPIIAMPTDTHGVVTSNVTSMLGTLIIVKIHPRPDAASTNCIVNGYDVHVAPQHVLRLWHALILHGQACPVGYCEYTALSMHTIPPLPVFPRDYPDTLDGQVYWSNDSVEWSLIREYFQSGGGRLFRHQEDNDVVQCSELVTDDSSAVMQPIVVRGCFGDPIRAALQNSCVPKPPWSKRRRRCSSRQSLYVVPTKPLAGTDLERHQETCTVLLQSLTLPAVLVCYVVLVGKGTVQPGTKLYVDTKVLGMVTAGSFSNTHGKYHAVCMASTRALLESIHDVTNCVYVPHQQRGDEEGNRRIKEVRSTVQIRVQAATTPPIEAVLSILQ